MTARRWLGVAERTWYYEQGEYNVSLHRVDSNAVCASLTIVGLVDKIRRRLLQSVGIVEDDSGLG